VSLLQPCAAGVAETVAGVQSEERHAYSHHPELPSAALTAVEKNELELGVLSDLGNGLAKRLGIFLVQPEVMRGLLEEIGVDWEARNGVEELGVPVPATFLVDQEGVVRNSYVEGDYTKRLEPAVAMEWIEAL